jgi:hypothetical protein
MRLLLIVLCFCVSEASAQHLRMYACILANDEAGSSMAGSSLGSGLWQSDDTGKTWKQLGSTHVKGYSMRVEPGSEGRVLYFAAGNGLWRSSDAGRHWKVLTDWRITEVMDVEIEPDDHASIWIATAHGIWHSSTSGAEWHPVQQGIPQPYVSALRFKHGRLYAAAEAGVFFFAQGKWNKVSNSPRAARTISDDPDFLVACDSHAVIRVEGDRASRLIDLPHRWWTAVSTGNAVIAGGAEGVAHVRGTDTVQFAAPRNVHALLHVGSLVLAGSLGQGIWYRAERSQQPWQPLALPTLQVWSLHSALVR